MKHILLAGTRKLAKGAAALADFIADTAQYITKGAVYVHRKALTLAVNLETSKRVKAFDGYMAAEIAVTSAEKRAEVAVAEAQIAAAASYRKYSEVANTSQEVTEVLEQELNSL